MQTIKIEKMTSDECVNGARALSIDYSIHPSPFGQIIIASTTKGICYMAFIMEEEAERIEQLQSYFPNAVIRKQEKPLHDTVMELFDKESSSSESITLHLKCTDFQLKVWTALLNIPFGKLTTYKEVANAINSPKASRAVGSAIGKNPIAYVIPCHRVIQSNGNTGEYMWGSRRKTEIIEWEKTIA